LAKKLLAVKKEVPEVVEEIVKPKHFLKRNLPKTRSK